MTEDTEPHSDQPDVEIPKDEAEVIRQMEEDKGEELTEQEKNLAIAQAELIGDL